jgi:enoyl-[acyl-carrier protein] reductase II
VKDAIVRAQDVCTVSVPKDFMLARDLSNTFTRQYLEMRKAGAPDTELAAFLVEHSQYPGQHLGDTDNGEVCCGQVAGLINSQPRAAEVIEGIIKNLSLVLEELKRKLAAFPA